MATAATSTGTTPIRKARILVVDDEEGVRRYCRDSLLTEDIYEVTTVADPRQALEKLKSSSFDGMLTDIAMPGGMTGIDLVAESLKLDPSLQIVIMTAFPTVETAVEALRLGAADYLTKPFLPDDLINTLNRVIDRARLAQENQGLRRHWERRYAFDELLGGSMAMQEVFKTIERVAASDVDVFIHGETGTGKELVARSLHKHSRRAQGPFVPVDCGAIPENLLESEFFGHERGAFTGAEARSIGLMELAHGGTFFLDEVGELPLMLQAKMLRALQERLIRRVGGKEFIPADVRVVAATARDLEALSRQGKFRDDLYFRINVVRIGLPPLRDRIDDVPMLAESFLGRFAHQSANKVTSISQQAIEVLQHYHWPGNVRELQNVIRRGLAMATREQLDVEDLPDHVVNQSDAREGDKPGFFAVREDRINRFEQQYLAGLLEQCKGDVSKAAEQALIPLGTYYRLMKKHALKASDFR